jgi:hypothetical protein
LINNSGSNSSSINTVHEDADDAVWEVWSNSDSGISAQGGPEVEQEVFDAQSSPEISKSSYVGITTNDDGDAEERHAAWNSDGEWSDAKINGSSRMTAQEDVAGASAEQEPVLESDQLVETGASTRPNNNARKRHRLQERKQLEAANSVSGGGLRIKMQERANTNVKLYDSSADMLGHAGGRSGEMDKSGRGMGQDQAGVLELDSSVRCENRYLKNRGKSLAKKQKWVAGLAGDRAGETEPTDV